MYRKLGAILCASVCFAGPGPFELGGTIGYGVYRNTSVNAPAGTATAGFHNAFSAGAFFGEDLYQHLSGELRYTFQDGDPFVSAGGMMGTIQGQSHAVHYEFLLHPTRRSSKIRPYFAVGAGIKDYRTNGPAPVPQPLPQIVTLAPRHDDVGLFTAGVGVRYRLTNRMYLRGDFLDYLTPFPKQLFVPAANGADRGYLHQFTPSLGISFRP